MRPGTINRHFNRRVWSRPRSAFPSVVRCCVLALACIGASRGALAQGGTTEPGSRPAAKTASKSASRGFATPRGADALATDLSALLHGRVKRGTWGAMVVSLTHGDTLFAYDAGKSMLPASTMKLYTSALAFERLGPYYRFKTEVLRDGTLVPDGTLNGNLVIRGGGDPAFSSRFIPGDPNAPMRALARQVHAAGVRRVKGDVIGDDRAFESKLVPEGWLSRYLQASYAARISALSLNENLLHVVVAPGAGGGAATVSLQPPTTAYTVVNSAKTTAGSRGAKLTVARTGTGAIAVRGWIGTRSDPRVYVVVVEDPATFATGAFAQALVESGITVDGAARVAPTPNGAVPLTVLPSPTLVELARVMNQESINHFAELIFRNVARHADSSGIGTVAMANALLRDFLLLRVRSRPDDVYAADGSGLSTLDRSTARSQVQLLSYAHRAPWTREFHATLPLAGREETLRLRMRATPAQGNLHAKTGTTNDVVALSGYVAARDGEMLAFSFLYNGRDRWNARATIDAMGATLAGFSR